MGKSSPINRLLGGKSGPRQRDARQDGNHQFYRLQECRLVDLLGYGYAKVSFLKKSAGRSWWRAISTPGEHPPGDSDRRPAAPAHQDDLQMLAFLRALDLPFAIVLTKSDKLNRTERAKRMELLKTELKAIRCKANSLFSCKQ